MVRSLLTLVKLALAIAVLYALWNVGQSFWRNYQFKDALTQTATHGTRSPVEAVHARAVKAAAELGVPVKEEDIRVRREGDLLIIEATYVEQVKIFPSYFYPYRFSARGEAVVLP